MGLVEGCLAFFFFLRSLWDFFPNPVQMLILGGFVIANIFGLMKMID